MEVGGGEGGGKSGVGIAQLAYQLTKRLSTFYLLHVLNVYIFTKEHAFNITRFNVPERIEVSVC